MKKVVGILLLGVAISCGSAAQKTVKRNDHQNVIAAGLGNGLICGTDSQTVIENPTRIPLQKLDGSSFKLCQIMEGDAAGGAKTDVFQFTSSDCIGCRKEAQDIEAYIAANNLAGKVRHYVVFVDNSAETAPTIAAFMNNYAPKAYQLDDKSGASAEVLFGARDTVFPLALVINNNGDRDIKFYGEGTESVTDKIGKLLSAAK